MACMFCLQDPCICFKVPLPPVKVVSRGSSGNSLKAPVKPIPFRVMSWNIERLGDTGNLGKHGGKRPDDVLLAIAQVIHQARPHICAVIEVFTEALGKEQMNAIFSNLNALGRSQGIVYAGRYSDGRGTGGLSDLDGSNRNGREGYGLVWRKDLGIDCTGGRWLKIYGDDELYDSTSKGRSYVRDAFEFTMSIKGNAALFGGTGQDITFPIAVFHAPGPRADLQRQALIKKAITELFRTYSVKTGGLFEHPNAFICADFNASEDANNLVDEGAVREVNYSFPGDLVYMERLVRVVTKIQLLNQWIAKNQGMSGLSWPQKDAQALTSYLTTDHFKEVAMGSSPVVIKQLETTIETVENWFAKNSQRADLSGVREAEKAAKVLLNEIMEERVKRRISNEQYDRDKARFKLWKTALNAKTQKKFSEAYWAIEEMEGSILQYYTDEDTPIQKWEDVQDILRQAFEDEFEDEQAFLTSRTITTYTDKVVSETLKSVRDMIANTRLLTIQEGYETAFSLGVDGGFFESTSYNPFLRSTRRKTILLTDFALKFSEKWSAVPTASMASVRFSNYDQVLSRTDAIRFDTPMIEAVPVFECVMPPVTNSTGGYRGCAYKKLTFLGPHRFLVRLCKTAKAAYTSNLPKDPKKLDFKLKDAIAKKVFDLLFKPNNSHCCKETCITTQDFKTLYELQTYLTRSHALSDHEPVLMTVLLYPRAREDVSLSIFSKSSLSGGSTLNFGGSGGSTLNFGGSGGSSQNFGGSSQNFGGQSSFGASNTAGFGSGGSTLNFGGSGGSNSNQSFGGSGGSTLVPQGICVGCGTLTDSVTFCAAVNKNQEGICKQQTFCCGTCKFTKGNWLCFIHH